MNRTGPLLEICIDSVEAARAAQKGGAQRVELCSDLLEGGITPSAGLIAAVRSQVSIGLMVMVRPRGGDFCYSGLEFEVMQQDIHQARALGADGIVLGILDEDARVDVPRTRQLVQLAAPLPVTFHRAIDMTPDPVSAVQSVLAAGAARILTSGGAPDALHGAVEIARMIQTAAGRICIMPGGGVTAQNVAALAHATGASEFHAGLRTELQSPVRFRKPGMTMGYLSGREFLRHAVEPDCVRELAEALAASSPLSY